MRIVDRATFMALPAGTLFAEGEPWAFEPMRFKYETLPSNDWVELDPCGVAASSSMTANDYMEDMLVNGSSYPMEDSCGRNGLFHEKAVFLVFERADLLKLRDMIDEAITVAQDEQKAPPPEGSGASS